MKRICNTLLVSAAIAVAPLAAGMAQQNNPAGNYGSNRSETATPGTADSKAASGMNTGDVNSKSTYPGTMSGGTMPGGTGRTVVPGNNSSQANAARGTANTKTGGTGGEGGK
jgi:hypothetical protein